MKNFDQDRAVGAFLGLALGDAYGRPLEFLSGDTVRNTYVSVDPNDFMWTDDTHMSIYLGQALLNCSFFEEEAFGKQLGNQFLLWTEDPLTPTTSPGNTCLAGMRNYAALRDWRTSGITASDGCGAVMRVVAIPLVLSDEYLQKAAEISAKITHAHPDALASAVATCMILQNTLENKKLDGAYILQVAQEVKKMYPKAINTPKAMESAVRLSDFHNLDWLDEAAIAPGDGGWRSSSALGLALCAALRWGSNFEEAIDKATRINGDSDSVGCLTGMFLGAEGGTSKLPTSWLNSLPARSDLETLAQKLYSHNPIQKSEDPHMTSLHEDIIRLYEKSSDFKEDLALFQTKMRFSVPKKDRNAARILLRIAEQLGENIGTTSNSYHISIDKSLVPGRIFQELLPQSVATPEKEETTKESPPDIETTEARTSITHPIFVNWLELQSYNKLYSGKIGLTFAPGKKGSSMYGKQWLRDLCIDLDRLKSFYQTDVIVSFIEDSEMVYLQIPEINIRSEERGMPYYRFPLVDGTAPKPKQIREVIGVILPLLRAGKRVVLHCRGGLGRAGTFAACTLVAIGFTAKEAMEQTRKARAGAIENIQQERAIIAYAKMLQNIEK